MEGSDGGGRVLVAGTINTDLVVWVARAPGAGETVTGSRFAVFAGGKAANQTVACARSGAATAILGAVGDDDFGRQRLADLAAEGVDHGDVEVVEGVASGVALITVEEGGENRIAYVPGATLTVPPERARRAFARVRPAVVLTTLELPLETLDALYDTARDGGATTILNATPEPETGRRLLPRVDVLVVNETEALALAGGSDGADRSAVAAALQRLGPRVVVITLGAAGGLLRIGEATMLLPAPRVEVVDTTGAGDAFCGAFAAALAAGRDVPDAARRGVVAGSLAVTRAGAQPSMPTIAAIAAMLATG